MKKNTMSSKIISFVMAIVVLCSSEIVEAKPSLLAEANEIVIQREREKRERWEKLGISHEDLDNNDEKLDISEKLSEVVPEAVNDYAKERLYPLVETVKNNYTDFGIHIDEVGGVELGESFVIYSAEELGNQDPIYYYPVLDEGEIILVLFVMEENGEYSAGISADYVEQLEDLKYQEDNDYLFYEDENGVYAENEKCIKKLYDKECTEKKDDENLLNVEVFEELSTENKVNAIVNSYSKNRTQQVYDGELRAKEQGFSSYTVYVVKLNTLGCLVAQGNYGNCWAATVATTVRYLNYSQYKYLTAKNVCDAMGIGYNDGATMLQQQHALHKYLIGYRYYKSQIRFPLVQQNIQNKKPVIAGTIAGKSAHSITVIGYTTYGGINQITFHNPGTNKVSSVEYKSTGTTYTYNNKIYKWIETLSDK